MSGWKAKRFWKAVSLEAVAGGYRVLLDARPVRTPAKQALVLPSRAMAQAVADEWRAVDREIRPAAMPVTRAANSAIDKVTAQFDEVAALIAAYGASDLLCYRAEAPEALARAQAEAWDPLLDWAGRVLEARLTATRGVVPVAQPQDALAALEARVRAATPFQLTALHDLVSLTGSLVLGLAATSGDFDPETLWRLSRFDEDWQAERWGEDEEASAIAEGKRLDFLRACHFWKISTPYLE